MRFQIKEFSIDDLLLDEGNYRFQKASDQNNCIEKIYSANKPYFINLMNSVAEDDLGEPLLVYEGGVDNIVLDGNRRTAALKVIYRPEMAPSAKVRELAVELKRATSFNFTEIQAQYSKDRSLILKTVYERHAAGQGKSRIDWTAFANAKFRFDERLADGQDWHDIALLMELESRSEKDVEFAYTPKYSHDVFRRIVRAAIQRGLIDKGIFSEKNKRILRSRKQSVKHALDIVREFLAYMEGGHINLSRRDGGGTYADKKKVDEYLESIEGRFGRPDPKTITEGASPEEGLRKFAKDEESSQGEDSQSTSSDVHRDPRSEGGGGECVAPDQKAEAPNPAGPSIGGGASLDRDKELDKEEKIELEKPQLQIHQSQDIIKLLNEIKSLKLSSLYRSLASISLRYHPALAVIGAWAFLETIARNAGASDGNSFDSYFGSKLHDWFAERSEKQSMKAALAFISSEGNCNKHCKIYVTVNAEQLVTHFAVLDPLIVRALQEILRKRKSRRAAT